MHLSFGKAENLKILEEPLPMLQLLSEHGGNYPYWFDVNIKVDLGDLFGLSLDGVLDFFESKVCSDCFVFNIDYTPVLVAEDKSIVFNITGYFDEETVREAELEED